MFRPLLPGFGFSGYRSFFPGSPSLIGPLTQVAAIAGQNNSGKSNILRFAAEQLNPIITKIRNNDVLAGLGEKDASQGQPAGFSFRIAIEPENVFAASGLQRGQPEARILTRVTETRALRRGTEYCWFRWDTSPSTRKLEISGKLADELVDELGLSQQEWALLSSRTTGGAQNVPAQDAHRALTQISAKGLPGSIPVEWIPELRGHGLQDDDSDFAGRGLIKRLHELERPGWQREEQAKKSRFESIVTFLQTVTGDSTARLEPRHDANELVVHMDGRVLPLESLGTGVREVVILAAAATLLENTLVGIEEPEAHLHPTLQRKLLRYLATKTSNQYLLTTHSGALLDTSTAQIFHVWLSSNGSRVKRVLRDADRASICFDLGYRASDLVQANAIIWVEGPSDRIYVNAWIAAKAPDLVLDLDYSIMFYGGSLLAHVSSKDDPIVDEFVNLRRLNRNMVVLMDLDRSEAGQANATKRRIAKAFQSSEGRGFAWITKGREIENYLDPDTLREAIQEIYGANCVPEKTGQFDRVWLCSKKDRPLKADKLRLARAITKKPPSFSMLDLDKRTDQLVAFIRAANSGE